MTEPTYKPLCLDGWAVPPTPLMIKHGHDYHTCSECGEPCNLTVSKDETVTVRGEGELREQLAAIEYKRWADWQRWMHTKGRYDIFNGEDVYVFPRSYIEHLTHQINTDYSGLSEAEKQSDREQVDRYWPLIEAEVASRLRELLDGLERDGPKNLPVYVDGQDTTRIYKDGYAKANAEWRTVIASKRKGLE